MMSGGFSISSATIFARDLEKTSRFLIDTIGFDSVDNGSQEGKVTLKLNADCVIALQQLTNVKSDGKMVDNVSESSKTPVCILYLICCLILKSEFQIINGQTFNNLTSFLHSFIAGIYRIRNHKDGKGCNKYNAKS